MPVARLSGIQHPQTIRTRLAQRKAIEWLRASGASRVWPSNPIQNGVTGGQHPAGTCRMFDGPATSVTDPDGRSTGPTTSGSWTVPST
jgi:choline dehydrogenase-like flavoprotein